MALFEYFGLDKSSRRIKGIINAESLDEAKAILNQKDIIAFKISLIKNKKKKLTKKEILSLFQQLENLLAAGIPLYESLSIMAEKNERKKIKLLILDLCEKIKLGNNLSDAMKEHPKNFDLIMCFMVENAQKTARLQECLNEIIDILSNNLKLKKRLVAAFTYPLVLFVFCMIILNFLIFITIPSLFDLFEGRSLHPFTKMVFSISKIACEHKFLIFIMLLSVICFCLLCYLCSFIRKKIYEFFLKMPILKTFMIKLAFIRFCRSFANLLLGGESYLNALSLATNILNHPILYKQFFAMKNKLMEGHHLSDLLKNSEFIPQTIPKMLSIAEETSKMPQMLINIAKIYEDEVDKFLSKITAILQPLLLIIIGLIVGFVVLSILIPLTDVSSFIGE